MGISRTATNGISDGNGIGSSGISSGASFSPLSLSPLAWARCPDAPGSVSCVITLTGDIAAVFGGQPLDISGQMVSKTVPASPASVYAAGGPAVPVSWTGWRGIAYKVSSFSVASTSTAQGFLLADTSTSTFVQVSFDAGTGTWFIDANGVIASFKSGTVLEKVGFRVDGATGDAEVVIGGVTKTKADYPSLGGVFSGAEVESAALFGLSGADPGDTYAAQIFTAAADLTDVGFPAGTLDWCGNAIGVPVPGLYQDSAGTTPVTGAGQDVGLREDQSGNSADFTQATATARPTYEGDRLEYDVDDALSCTLPAISGGQIVIISPAGTWIDDFDFAGGTFTVGPDTYTGGPAGLMSLLGNAEIEIIILPTPMTVDEQAKMVAYAQGLGSAGLITETSEIWTYDADVLGAGWSESGEVYSHVAPNVGNVTNPILTVGKHYIMSMVASNVSAGQFRGRLGSSGTTSAYLSANGSLTFIGTASGSMSAQIQDVSGAFVGDVTVSVREVIMP